MKVKEGTIGIWASGGYEQMKYVWLLDSGADVHVLTIGAWEGCGKPRLIESDVALKAASGEDLGAIGKIKVRGFLDGQRAELETAQATKVHRCLLSGIKLREGGYSVTMAGDGSYLEKDDKRLHLARDGKRDVVNFAVYKKVKQANVVTAKGLQREVSKVKGDVGTMRMGPAPGMTGETKPLTKEQMK